MWYRGVICHTIIQTILEYNIILSGNSPSMWARSSVQYLVVKSVCHGIGRDHTSVWQPSVTIATSNHHNDTCQHLSITFWSLAEGHVVNILTQVHPITMLWTCTICSDLLCVLCSVFWYGHLENLHSNLLLWFLTMSYSCRLIYGMFFLWLST